MRPIARSYEIQNEYTNPLCGKPYYRNSGISYAVDRSGDKYAVSRVDFERFDEQNFQYIFSPEWSLRTSPRRDLTPILRSRLLQTEKAESWKASARAAETCSGFARAWL